MKNKTSGLFMEVGVEFEKKRLHGKRYFDDFVKNVKDVPPSVIDMARRSTTSKLLSRFEMARAATSKTARPFPSAFAILPRKTASSRSFEKSLRSRRSGDTFRARRLRPAAQQTPANHAGRSGQTCSELERTPRRDPRTRARARQPQPGDARGGAASGGIPAGSRQEQNPLRPRPTLRSLRGASRPPAPLGRVLPAERGSKEQHKATVRLAARSASPVSSLPDRTVRGTAQREKSWKRPTSVSPDRAGSVRAPR